MPVLDRMLLVSFLLCVGIALGITNDKTVIRREGRGGQQVQLDQQGHIQVLGNEAPLQADLLKVTSNDDLMAKYSAVTDCNKQYLQMADEGKDECTGNPPTFDLADEAACKEAAANLTLAYGGEVDNHLKNPLDAVHKCLFNKTSGEVHWNPTEPNSTGTLVGSKICWRTLYHFVQPEAGQSKDLCSGDAKVVPTFDECLLAMTCAAGGEACRLIDFKEGRHISDPEKPAGCWKDHIGCWSYNNKTADEVSFTSDTNLTQVCRNAPPSSA
jgi:hypothetical protein